jgi:tetratricopeptide (TPR) repeat protein
MDPRLRLIRENDNRSSSLMALLLGDSRQLLATHFYKKADAYFHNGTYPSIFEEASTEESHMTARSADHDEHDGHDEHDEHDAANTNNAPNDWIQRFGRHFILTAHEHLGNGNEREILPWLKISADLDPHRVTTYVTVAYWLRKKLNKPAEAEQFLRLGLRNNPDSPEIYCELGMLNSEKNPVLAHRLWELAIEKWDKQDKAGLKPDDLVRMEALGQLALSEDTAGRYDQSLAWLEKLKAVSPNSESIDKLIEKAKAKTPLRSEPQP